MAVPDSALQSDMDWKKEGRIDFPDLGLLAGRACLAANFIYWGTQKFLNPPNIAHVLESAGLPGVLVYPTFVLQILGGLMTLFGIQTRLAALLLGWFCIVAPSIFWINAPMNMARDYSAAGGFIILLILGAGKLSIDAVLPSRFDVVAALVAKLRKGWSGGLLIARLLVALPLLTDATIRLIQLWKGGQADPAYHLTPIAMMLMLTAEIAAGFSIAFGWRVRIAALAILPLWIWGAMAFHMPLLSMMAEDGLSITKDLTTMGALLILAARHGRQLPLSLGQHQGTRS